MSPTCAPSSPPPSAPGPCDPRLGRAPGCPPCACASPLRPLPREARPRQLALLQGIRPSGQWASARRWLQRQLCSCRASVNRPGAPCCTPSCCRCPLMVELSTPPTTPASRPSPSPPLPIFTGKLSDLSGKHCRLYNRARVGGPHATENRMPLLKVAVCSLMCRRHSRQLQPHITGLYPGRVLHRAVPCHAALCSSHDTEHCAPPPAPVCSALILQW